jgi:hypothetical protein
MKRNMHHSLEVYRGENLIFFSNDKWLYPLFELEKFIHHKSIKSEEIFVRDKIIGKAAAFIIIYLGIKEVKAELMSILAKDLFDQHFINYKFEKLIERIDCKTENLLEQETDPRSAYKKILELVDKNKVLYHKGKK